MTAQEQSNTVSEIGRWNERIHSTGHDVPAVIANVVALAIQDVETGNYRRPTAPTVCILLVKGLGRTDEWTLPGGEIRRNESFEQCVERELESVASLGVQSILPVGPFSNLADETRGWVVSCGFLSIVRKTDLSSDTCGVAHARWVSVEDVLSAKIKLAFNHLEIVQKALERLRLADQDSLVFQFVPDEFTLAELQFAYEFITGRKILGPNFRRKIKSLVEVVGIGEEDRVGHRPARLFRQLRS